MGPTWGPPGSVGPRWAPCWPREPCYQGRYGQNFVFQMGLAIKILNIGSQRYLSWSSVSFLCCVISNSRFAHILVILICQLYKRLVTLIARFKGPTWGPSGAERTQVGPMLSPWTLLSGRLFWNQSSKHCVAPCLIMTNYICFLTYLGPSIRCLYLNFVYFNTMVYAQLIILL